MVARTAKIWHSRHVIPALIVGSVFSWGLAILLSRYPGYIYYDTADGIMWSRNGFTLNTVNHPPLFVWLLHAVELVFPLNSYVLMLLGNAIILCGVIAIWRIAIQVIGSERAIYALVLCAFVPYLTWIGHRLNHNTLMITLWPMTVWAFLACLQKPTYFRGCLFGAVAAVGILSKY